MSLPKPKAVPGDVICENCHYVGVAAEITPGSSVIELILWLTFLLPGLIYSIWRASVRGYGCPLCGCRNLIPAISPRGQQMVDLVAPRGRARLSPLVMAAGAVSDMIAGIGPWIRGLFGAAPYPSVDAKMDLDLANLGSPEAQYVVALRYLDGDGVKRDPGEARTWLEKSAAQGHPEAPARLAAMQN